VTVAPRREIHDEDEIARAIGAHLRCDADRQRGLDDRRDPQIAASAR